jgi:hypothetical protein
MEKLFQAIILEGLNGRKRINQYFKLYTAIYIQQQWITNLKLKQQIGRETEIE